MKISVSLLFSMNSEKKNTFLAVFIDFACLLFGSNVQR